MVTSNFWPTDDSHIIYSSFHISCSQKVVYDGLQTSSWAFPCKLVDLLMLKMGVRRNSEAFSHYHSPHLHHDITPPQHIVSHSRIKIAHHHQLISSLCSGYHFLQSHIELLLCIIVLFIRRCVHLHCCIPTPSITSLTVSYTHLTLPTNREV